MSKSSAYRPELEGRMYHISLGTGQLPRYVLLPGDPGRVDEICDQMDDAEVLSSHREYRVAKGRYGGFEIGVCSTGIGGPSTAIAVEELARIGCDTFIRVGSTGTISDMVRCGELIINTASMGLGGTSKEYVPPEYPSCANHEVTMALIQSCENRSYPYHVGISASTDSFYVGQARESFKGYLPSNKANLISDLCQAKVLNFEMECSTLFTISNIFGLRAGSVCAVYANRATDTLEKKGMKNAILASLEAMKSLCEWDGLKKDRGKRYFYPDLLK